MYYTSLNVTWLLFESFGSFNWLLKFEVKSLELKIVLFISLSILKSKSLPSAKKYSKRNYNVVFIIWFGGEEL